MDCFAASSAAFPIAISSFAGLLGPAPPIEFSIQLRPITPDHPRRPHDGPPSNRAMRPPIAAAHSRFNHRNDRSHWASPRCVGRKCRRGKQLGGFWHPASMAGMMLERGSMRIDSRAKARRKGAVMSRLVMVIVVILSTLVGSALAQGPAGRGRGRPRAGAARPVVLKPARVFDGIDPEAHDGWAVVVRGERIEAAGPAGEIKVPEGARVIDLPGMTLLPGLIDLHTHVLLHPYDEALWDDQVLKEALALRVCSRDEPPQEQSAVGVHHDPRPGDRGGGLRRRRAEAGGRAGDRPRPADAGRHPGDRGDRQLRAEGFAPSGGSPRGPRKPMASTP